MTELKPCPFCGGKARMETFWDFYRVSCMDERCCGYAYGGNTSTDCTWYGSIEEARDAWNRRHERTCVWKAVCDERYWETECGCTYVCYDAAEPPNYCGNCGGKVVSKDE